MRPITILVVLATVLAASGCAKPPEGMLWNFHESDSVNTVALSPDGTRLVTGSLGGTVRVWNLETGELERTLAELTDVTQFATFSPDGRTVVLSQRYDLASNPVPGDLRMWDVETWTESTPVTDVYGIGDIAFTPDGKSLLLATSDGRVYLWDVATQKSTGDFRGHAEMLQCVTVSRDGRLVAAGGNSGTVIIWEFDGAAKLHELDCEIDMVRGIAFSKDGRTIACTGNTGVQFWDVETGERREKVPNDCEVHCVTYSPDGETVAWGACDGTLTLWDVASNSITEVVEAHERPLEDIAYSADGKLLATCGAGVTTTRNPRPLPGNARVWSMPR